MDEVIELELVDLAGIESNETEPNVLEHVNGQRDFPVGGQLISLLADM